MSKAENNQSGKSFALESLYSRYVPEQHESYLRYLLEILRLRGRGTVPPRRDRTVPHRTFSAAGRR